MEILNFAVWAVVVLGIGGFAIASMISAFRKPVTQTPFPNTTVKAPSIPLTDSASSAFIAATATHNAGDYRKAIEQLTPVVEQEPNCAEAWHNIGLAYANVGDNNKAVRSLIKASDAYDKQGTKAGIDQIKTDLERLKAVSE
ncbi:MAG: tetratricopeptide repeat protein [Phormidesmis sp.]